MCTALATINTIRLVGFRWASTDALAEWAGDSPPVTAVCSVIVDADGCEPGLENDQPDRLRVGP